MKGASGTAGDTGGSPVAVNVRVRVYPGTDGEVGGTVVEDFGDLAGHVVDIGENHIVGPRAQMIRSRLIAESTPERRARPTSGQERAGSGP